MQNTAHNADHSFLIRPHRTLLSLALPVLLSLMAEPITGVIALHLLDLSQPGSLTRIWLIIACWILIRGLLGVVRIWPGIGKAPLGKP